MDNKELKRLAEAGIQAEITRLNILLGTLKRRSPLVKMAERIAPRNSEPRRRPELTPAQRKAIGIRMKAMWAAKRAEKMGSGGQLAAPKKR